MHPVFITGKAADSVPIWFVTTATWNGIRERLDAAARAFADA
ncbi:MAG: hypothetical protein QOD40_263, partial [Alphaproteobacteria bacterium]|nr:hypothetical protein [Alphaproteobacteria bacterium]